jgi:ribosome-associated protein
MIEITPTITLDDSELEWSFVRASGPGGQNVNKVSSAVKLRFDAANSRSLPERVRLRLRAVAGKRLTRDGVLIIDARRHRSQEQNRRDALERLCELIRRAAAPPPRPRKVTKPSRSARRRRMQDKRRRGDLKRLRGPVDADK